MVERTVIVEGVSFTFPQSLLDEERTRMDAARVPYRPLHSPLTRFGLEELQRMQWAYFRLPRNGSTTALNRKQRQALFLLVAMQAVEADKEREAQLARHRARYADPHDYEGAILARQEAVHFS